MPSMMICLSMLLFTCSAMKHMHTCDRQEERDMDIFAKPATRQAGRKKTLSLASEKPEYENLIKSFAKTREGTFLSFEEQKDLFYAGELSKMLREGHISEAFAWTAKATAALAAETTAGRKNALQNLPEKLKNEIKAGQRLTKEHADEFRANLHQFLSPPLQWITFEWGGSDQGTRKEQSMREFLFQHRTSSLTRETMQTFYQTTDDVFFQNPINIVPMPVTIQKLLSLSNVDRNWDNSDHRGEEIVTFNILSDALLKQGRNSPLDFDASTHWNGQDLLPGRGWALLSELLRLRISNQTWTSIVEHVKRLGNTAPWQAYLTIPLDLPYALTMQEVDDAHFGFFARHLKGLGYRGAFLSKKGPVPKDGLAVFIRTDEDVKWFPWHLKGYVDGEAQAAYRQQLPYYPYGHRLEVDPELSWPQGALIGLVGDRVIATFHGGADPGLRGDVLRELQLKEVYIMAESISSQAGLPNPNIIITGDMNADPRQQLWTTAEALNLKNAYPKEFWTTSKAWERFGKRLDTVNEEALEERRKEGLHISNHEALARYLKDPDHEALARYLKDTSSYFVQIDAIFCNQNVRALRHLNHPKLNFETASPLMPSIHYPSDHLLLAAQVSFAKNSSGAASPRKMRRASSKGVQ